MKVCLAFVCALVASLASTAVAVDDAPDPAADLTPQAFADPPVDARPWTYYWNLKGNTSEELVKRDVDDMAKIGLGGMLVFDSRRYWDDYDSKTHVPVPLEIKHEFMSESWQDVMATLVGEAGKRGMQVSFNISDSGGQLRGPWDMKELGPYELIWTEENIDGPKSATLDFSIPDDKPYYKDVAAFAARISTDVSEGREAVKLNATWGQVALDIPADAPRYDKLIRLPAPSDDGRLDVQLGEGHWKILRFGSVRIGEPGCVDILNPRATEAYFRKMPGALLDRVGADAGKTLSHFYNVSWEGVHPNWTDGFAEFFESRRGYPIWSYLPILRGLAPNDDPDPNRFVADYARAISDAFRANCYETIGRLCHERGVKWHSEDGGPWNRKSPLFREADMLTFWGQNDFPQGEFWIGKLKQTNAPYAAMAAHIYGRRYVSLEAFTHMIKHWSVYPGMLKPYADASFLAGANRMIWHTYTASSEELGKPGYEYFAGTHLNSNVTWHNYVRPFIDYMARCQLLLRQGDFVADVCAYASDKNYVTWGLAEKWNEASELALPKGYRYDLLDTKVLVERMEYKDGYLTLPGGAKYRLLVFDPIEDAIPIEATRKIKALAEQGAPILLGKTRPRRSVSLRDRVAADEETREIADELWNSNAPNVFRERSVAETLDALGIAPDFATDSEMQFAHRAGNGFDVYFVSTPDESVDVAENCVFRAANHFPTLWNPLDGSVTRVRGEILDDGRVQIAKVPRSTLVVFTSKEIDAQDEKEERPVVARIAPDARFEVRFDPNYGAPKSVEWDALQDWTANENANIKYYSGTATYVFKLNLDAETAKRDLRVKLGRVCDIARVRLNGEDCGVAWTAPFDVELGARGREGENILEVDVANCWRNRLIGDANLPPEERVTRSNVVLEKASDAPMPAYRGYVSTDPLEPSGLIGPVVVEAR